MSKLGAVQFFITPEQHKQYQLTCFSDDIKMSQDLRKYVLSRIEDKKTKTNLSVDDRIENVIQTQKDFFELTHEITTVEQHEKLYLVNKKANDLLGIAYTRIKDLEPITKPCTSDVRKDNKKMLVWAKEELQHQESLNNIARVRELKLEVAYYQKELEMELTN